MKHSQLFQKAPLRRLIYTVAPLLLVMLLLMPPRCSAASQTSTAKTPVPKKAASQTKSTAKKQVSKTPSKKKTAARFRRSRKRVVSGQRNIEPARVIEIQNALAAAGYYKAEPTGQWDENTSKAMSTYQQDNGFKTTGKPDALSLKKLGL